MRYLLSVILLTLLCESVAAGGVDEAKTALDRGDYATALRILVPLTAHVEVPGGREAFNELLQRGRDCPADLRSAVQAFLQQARAGDAQAAFVIGMLADGKICGLTDAGHWLTQAAASGVVEAQFWISFSAAFTDDHQTMLKWSMRCSDGGLLVCQAFMGQVYLKGDLIPRDIPKGVALITKAAHRGHFAAQFDLSRLYRDGIGVQRDKVQALMWFDVAIASEKVQVPGAAQLLVAPERRQLTDAMTAEEIARAEALAKAWQPSSSP